MVAQPLRMMKLRNGKLNLKYQTDPNGTDLRWFPFGLSLSKPSLPFDRLRANGPIWQAIARKSVPLQTDPFSHDAKYN
jgi:hypothetical protein